MKLRCAVLDDYQDVALKVADWAPVADEVDVTVFRSHFAAEDELVAAIRDFEIVVAMRERTPFRASLFARLPRLRLLVTTGMRNASIDLGAAADRGVLVCGTAGSSAPPAELTWALILGLARNIAVENAAFRARGPWQSTVGVDLYGARLGLLGLGKIGGRVARVGQAFGMDVVAWSKNLTRERADEVGVGLAPSMTDLLAGSDFVSVHLVLGDRTRGLIGAAEFERMRLSAYLINTSRAGIVDGPALVQALRTGQIAGAGLDVFEVEPLPCGDALRSLPNVLATPHIGYVTRGNYRTYYRDAVDDVVAFLAGSPIRQLS
ncbi:MAG: D-2-hydroxyacid dehydrogenase family protein [Streptosporangiaceae bacterium]